MKRKLFAEEKIVKALKRHEPGLKAADTSREYGIAEQTFCRWKSKYGRMDIDKARPLKELEEVSRRLKKLLADRMLVNAAIENAFSKTL